MTFSDEPFFEDWDSFDDGPEEPLETPRWRRLVILSVAAITVTAMALVPLYNLIDAGQPQLADNGLEVCGYDYCVVLDEVRNAGLGAVMSRMANTFLSDVEAESLATRLVSQLGETSVNMQIVDRLDGNIKGQYDPSSRTIILERPIRAWVVLHEVAHIASSGHGPDFQVVVNDLATWMESQSG